MNVVNKMEEKMEKIEENIEKIKRISLWRNLPY